MFQWTARKKSLQMLVDVCIHIAKKVIYSWPKWQLIVEITILTVLFSVFKTWKVMYKAKVNSSDTNAEMNPNMTTAKLSRWEYKFLFAVNSERNEKNYISDWVLTLINYSCYNQQFVQCIFYCMFEIVRLHQPIYLYITVFYIYIYIYV